MDVEVTKCLKLCHMIKIGYITSVLRLKKNYIYTVFYFMSITSSRFYLYACKKRSSVFIFKYYIK